ncbi:hypothetical protein ACWKWZ_11500 [Metapseudomonas otitidis]
MKPEMSEFSYGYAFTSELIASLGSQLVAAPEFPSLQQEGKPGGGYDVQINSGSPLFLQFKLSHYLARTNSKEHALMSGPYYRWHMHALRHSQQHNLLLNLERKGNDVFYVAPAFHLTSELNRYYLSGSIVEESAAFRPSAIGALPDREEHYVVFDKGHVAYRCSEDPLQIKFHMMRDWPFSEKPLRKPRLLNESGVVQIADEIIDVLRESKKQLPLAVHKSIDPDEVAAAVRSRPTLETLAFISRTVLDSELLIISPSGKDGERIQRRRRTR